jgi:RNase P subunit RPR2
MIEFEDSPDLTDDEVQKALPVNNAQELVKRIQNVLCSECSSAMLVQGHALRRRNPHIYWRVSFLCKNGHNLSRLYQTDWVKGEPV